MKGRYGRIAQFFGPDATYDAVKSFFAKEVARGAERLRDQRPDLRATGRPLLNGASSGSSISQPNRRFVKDDSHVEQEDGEEEEDIKITSVQQVQRYFSYPPRRPATIDLTDTAASPSQSGPVPSSRDGINAPTTNGMASPVDDSPQQQQQPAQQPANTRQKITSPIRPPGFLPGRSYQASSKQRVSQPVTGKRPYAATLDADETFEDANARDSQSQRQAVTKHLPFGYATRDKRYRCALCSSHFSSQQALKRHESTNRAHKNNLGNAFMVKRAHSRLETLREPADGESSQAKAGMRPAQVPLTNGTHTNGECRTPIIQTLHAESHQRAQHPALRPVSVSSTIDESESIQPPEVRSMLFSGPSARASMPAALPSEHEGLSSPVDGTQASSRDKGKGRATTPDLSSNRTVNRGEGEGGCRTYTSSDNASAERQLHRSLANVHNLANGQNTPSHRGHSIDTCPPPRAKAKHDDSEAYRTATAQLRASIGVLGERYIETHPEWLAQMMAAVQREVVRDVGGASNGDGRGFSNMPPPSSSAGASVADLRGGSVATTTTTSLQQDPMRNLFVGSRVGFGGPSAGSDARGQHVVGNGAAHGNHAKAREDVRMREVPGKTGTYGKADTVVIFVD